jgi:hypothetical protein
MISLKDRQPAAEGRQRYVFIHTTDPDLVIKIIRPDAIGRAWGKWYKLRRSYGQYLSYMREIGEYVTTHAREGGSPRFVQKVRGLVETDMGLGLVLDAVRGKDGALAPSLRSMLREGTFDQAAAQALETFFTELTASDVIASDLNGGNIVYAYDEGEGHRFVMIDGLGQHNLIPLKRVSRVLNVKGKVRRIAKLRRQIAAAQTAEAPVHLPVRPRRVVRFRHALLTSCAAAVTLSAFMFLLVEKSAPVTGGLPKPSSQGNQHPGGISKEFRLIDLGKPSFGPTADHVSPAGWQLFPNESQRIRLAPSLQPLWPFIEQGASILTNPYPGNGEDDMITTMEYLEPVIQ